MSTDKDWEKWGSANPYYGVLSDAKYLGSKLSGDKIEREFLLSGKVDIAKVASCIERMGHSGTFKHAVDFGCGVGRLTMPLTSIAKHVTGLDVSDSVLKEARSKRPAKLRSTVTYKKSDDALANLPDRYDLVHSYIVLQHIPPRRGMQLIKALLDRLDDGGFAALHITYPYEAPLVKKIVIALRNRFVPLHYLLNVLKGNPLTMPRMRMHLYDLGEVTNIFRHAGVSQVTYTTTDHGGYIGVMIIGQKQSKG